MEFYKILTKLITKVNEIEQIENQKKVEQKEKEKTYKKFIENIISFYKCEIKTEESKKFKKYWIEYLKDFIKNSINFCSQEEKKDIESFINGDNIKLNNNINQKENINNFINLDNINIKKSDNFELLNSNNYNIDIDNNSNNIDNKSIELNIDNNIKGFFPKNYPNKNINNNNNYMNLMNFNYNQNMNLNQNYFLFDNSSNPNSNSSELNNSKKDFNSNNHKDNNNINIFESIKDNTNFKLNNKNKNNSSKINQIYENENNKIDINLINNNNKNTEINYNNKLNNYNNINENKGFINNNINYYDNNKIKNNKINENDKEDDDKSVFSKKIEIIKDNDDTSVSSHPYNNLSNDKNKNNMEDNINNNFNNNIINNQINNNKIIINNNDNNKIKNNNKEGMNNNNNIYHKEMKKNNNKKQKNNKKPSNNNRNYVNPADKYEKEIDKCYNELFKEQNITQYIISSINDFSNNKKLNQICSKVFSLVENNKIEYINQIFKEKLTTLICVLFPFAKKQRLKISDYIFKTNEEVDKDLFKYLKSNILMVSDDSKIIDSLFNFSKTKTEKIENDFCQNLYLEEKNPGKIKIFSIYTFLVIVRNLRNYNKNFNDILMKDYLISFKIHFILEHQEFYSAISDDFIEVFNGLNFINVFYNGIFNKNNNNETYIIQKDEEINKYIFGKDKFVLSLEKICDFKIDNLFTERDNLIYKEVMKKLEHFYSIKQFNSNDINDLIYYSTNKYGNKESNFVINLVEHINEKIKYIYDNFNNYKNNLKNIEKYIFNLAKDNLNLNNQKEEKIFKYSINEIQKRVFNSLLEEINNLIDVKYKGKFQLYPYGSITQFLGGKNSDIDLYLNINGLKKDEEKIDFLYKLKDLINKITHNNANVVISTRLCIITFKYKDIDYDNFIDFDISIMGFCPYLHSILLRRYSLMEPRFPLLAITLKNFIGLINIKSSENKQEYLNSFSWMILLITFLQDIIKPNILPKLLSNPNNSINNFSIQYGQNRKTNYYFKSFENFIPNIKEESTMLPDTLFDMESSKKIYEEEIKKKEKNNLSCAEIFLYFLEFVIYYFKTDSVYVNCSIENEGYESMYNILNYYDNKNEVNKIDKRFPEYFKNKYCKCKNFPDSTKTRDGLILIRDPLDPHYNPGQTLRSSNFKIFMDNLKIGYITLIKYGDFNKVKNEILLKQEKEKQNII